MLLTGMCTKQEQKVSDRSQFGMIKEHGISVGTELSLHPNPAKCLAGVRTQLYNISDGAHNHKANPHGLGNLDKLSLVR